MTLRKIKSTLFLILACLLFSCSEQNKVEEKKEVESELANNILKLNSGDEIKFLMTQNWEVEDATSPLPKDLYDRTDDGIALMPGLSILSDNTIVENPRGNIRLGKFVFKDRELSSNYEDGRKAVYTISRATPKKMVLKRNEGGKITTLELAGDGVTHTNAKDNPFHPDYNRWRLKPTSPESEVALRTRLKNNMLFYEKFFKDHVDRDASSISFEALPCPLNWYQGGITIQSKKNLDLNWQKCFYSEADAAKARTILENALTMKHKWETKSNNWMKQMIPVLRSVQDSL